MDDLSNRFGYRPASGTDTVRANRHWWDEEARDYLAEHGDFLGDDGFVWCPEGLDEDDAQLVGDVAGRDVLEIGCGAAQCSRWVARHGGRVVGADLSAGMLATAHDLGAGARPGAGADVPGPAGLVQADARHLPFADESFDIAFSAYGAVPFVADPELIMSEAARVLRPGGRWVFSVTHPVRWAFPDDPGDLGLTAAHCYFDRTPYVEFDEDGAITYAEHHRTLGDRVRDIVRAGLVLSALVEPEWPRDLDRIWGGWSPLRGQIIPGTAIFVTHKPR